jgi:hypothetical protein
MVRFICSSVREPSFSLTEEVRKGLAGTVEGVVETESLREVFDDVGEVAFGQTEPLVERGALDLLALASGVDGPLDQDLTEEGEVAFGVGLGELLEGATVGGLDGRAAVAVALLLDERFE